MPHSFKAVSLTYKQAPVAIRELLALNEAACARLLSVLQHELFLSDVLVLSTCNRTEVYYWAEEDESTAILGALAQVTSVVDAARYSTYFTVLNTARGRAALV